MIMLPIFTYRRGKKNTKRFFTLCDYEINNYGINQLYKLNSPYISIFPINLRTILWKYYIKNYGPVWRWSKLHKEIEEKFKQLRNE